MKKFLSLPSPTSHFPSMCLGNAEPVDPAPATASAAPGNSTREISERLKLCRWPSLKMITMVAGPPLDAEGAPAKPLGTARQSNVARPATLTNLRIGLSLKMAGARTIESVRARLIYALGAGIVPQFYLGGQGAQCGDSGAEQCGFVVGLQDFKREALQGAHLDHG